MLRQPSPPARSSADDNAQRHIATSPAVWLVTGLTAVALALACHAPLDVAGRAAAGSPGGRVECRRDGKSLAQGCFT